MKKYSNRVYGTLLILCSLFLISSAVDAELGYGNIFDSLPKTQDQLSIPKPLLEPRYKPKYYLQDLLPIKREIDGSNNNKQNIKWGAAGIVAERFSGQKTRYEDNAGKPVSYLPSPREISNQVGALGTFQPNDQHINLLFVIWGQILDHQFVFTPQQKQQNKENMKIKIPLGDPFFDKQNTGTQQMDFVRSTFQMINGIRSPFNTVTAWIDASTVYGSTQQLASRLRSFINGKLKQSDFNMLPKDPTDKTGKIFDAGDARVNENFALTSVHTLLMRQHNRVCDQVIKHNPNLTDEQIYQISRNYVIGLYQKITYHDFLPKLLGPATYKKYFQTRNYYNSSIKPDIKIQMATGLFRVGHPLLNDDFSMRNQNGQVTKQFALKDAFARPDVFNKSTVLDQVLMGLMHTTAKQKNCQIVDSIRNFLVLDGANRQRKVDLFSLNLQRARDHGIVSYGNFRKLFGLNPISFTDMCPKSSDAPAALTKMYKNPDQMDLWVGIVCQKPVKNGVMGQLGSKSLGQFFSRLKYGDRFYFEWAYPKRIVDEIINTSLADIIRRNTQLKKIPSDSFKVIKSNVRQEHSSSSNDENLNLSLNNYYKKWTNNNH